MDPQPESAVMQYRKMCELSEQMVTAVHSGEWEQLVTLDRSLTECREKLANVDIATLSADERATGTTLIQQILAHQTEVQEHVGPWLEQIRQLLGTTATKRKIAQAYGVDRSPSE